MRKKNVLVCILGERCHLSQNFLWWMATLIAAYLYHPLEGERYLRVSWVVTVHKFVSVKSSWPLTSSVFLDPISRRTQYHNFFVSP